MRNLGPTEGTSDVTKGIKPLHVSSYTFLRILISAGVLPSFTVLLSSLAKVELAPSQHHRIGSNDDTSPDDDDDDDDDDE